MAGKIEANDGNPLYSLTLIKAAHTNKKTGQIQDAVIRDVVDLVQTEIASQSDDGADSTGASTNLSQMQINEFVEKVIS